MRHIEWEIKVTKLCNLRCAYCYEYDELGDPRRLSIEQWRAILESARWYHQMLALRNPQEPVATRFVWHGGESSVLPVRYYEEIVALQREVLGGIDYSNHAPTNLYRVKPELLEFWDRERFVLSISHDGAPGTRLTRSGKDSGAIVEANLRRLLATPRKVGLNSVLTTANLPHLIEIYDRLRDIAHSSPGKLYWNLIPLHASTTAHPRVAPYQLEPATAVARLLDLFRHWLDDPEPLSVTPLQEHYLAVLRKLLGAPRHSFARREFGETSLMVNTDGHLYLFSEAYDPAKSLGCLFEQPLQALMESRAYAASLLRSEQDTGKLCGGCAYDGQCNHSALIHGHSDSQGERCGMTFALLREIEAEVCSRGIIEQARRAGRQGIPNRQFVFRNAA